MLKQKLSKKLVKAMSPKSVKPSSSLKNFKSPKSLANSPNCFKTKEKDCEIQSMKKVIALLNEEKILLNEYKAMAAPKILNLEEKLEKTKNFYETELLCMQEYINLLKSAAQDPCDDIKELLKVEKARSSTFYQALIRKQTACKEVHLNLEKTQKINEELLKNKEKEKNEEIKAFKEKILEEQEKNIQEIQNLQEKYLKEQEKNVNLGLQVTKIKQAKSLQSRSLIEDLKNKLKNRLEVCLSQASKNFEKY